MQAKYMTITLESGGQALTLGKGQPYRLRSVQGLEAAPATIASAGNAGMHGDTVTNARLEARSLVLGGTIAYLDDLERLREKLARFLSPLEAGRCTIDYCGTKRQIEYRVEAFSIDEMANLWAPMDFSITLFCADPMLRSTDSYGRNIAAYLPPRATSSSCVPCSITRPSPMTAMLSAVRTMGSVCAIMITVLRRASRLRIARLTASSFSMSSDAVASSSSTMGESRRMARAMESRCLSPPERRDPFSPMRLA